MVLTPGDIKAIAAEIASQIITELKKPMKISFRETNPDMVRETSYNVRDTFMNSFKKLGRRTGKEI